MTHLPAPKRSGLAKSHHLEALLAEYNALYGLAEFRMGALDRRVPAAGAALLVFIGSVPALPGPAQHILLAAIPASLIWLLRTTINHARSFEDALRRIEAIEGAVNRLASDTLICFQTTHPSKGRAVGGRTGVETVLAVVFSSALLLGACGYLMVLAEGASSPTTLGYAGYLAAVTIALAFEVAEWRRYRYLRVA
jgi:hypothetical protein